MRTQNTREGGEGAYEEQAGVVPVHIVVEALHEPRHILRLGRKPAQPQNRPIRTASGGRFSAASRLSTAFHPDTSPTHPLTTHHSLTSCDLVGSLPSPDTRSVRS